MCKTEWRALYVPKNSDGTWDFSVNTRLEVLTWQAVAVTGGHGVEVHGFVMDPARVGLSSGLVPPDTVVIAGYDGRDQFFVTYLEDVESPDYSELEAALNG